MPALLGGAMTTSSGQATNDHVSTLNTESLTRALLTKQLVPTS